MEFLCRLCQGGHSQVVHGRQHPPPMFYTLRHDYDCLDGATVRADGGADTHVGLQQTVVPALAGAMEGKYHRPFLMGRPILRNEYLISEINGLDSDDAVDEAGLILFGMNRVGEQQAEK